MLWFSLNSVIWENSPDLLIKPALTFNFPSWWLFKGEGHSEGVDPQHRIKIECMVLQKIKIKSAKRS